MEIPAQMHPVALAWPDGFRPRCAVCRKKLHRASQIDGTVIRYCASGCRNELGLPFCVETTQQNQAQLVEPTERAAA